MRVGSSTFGGVTRDSVAHPGPEASRTARDAQRHRAERSGQHRNDELAKRT